MSIEERNKVNKRRRSSRFLESDEEEGIIYLFFYFFIYFIDEVNNSTLIEEVWSESDDTIGTVKNTVILLIHIDVLMLCRKFELILTKIFRVMAIFKNLQIFWIKSIDYSPWVSSCFRNHVQFLLHFIY